MKKIITNILSALAVAAGLAASVFAPWWVVVFVCIPVAWAGAVTLIAGNTDWIKTY